MTSESKIFSIDRSEFLDVEKFILNILRNEPSLLLKIIQGPKYIRNEPITRKEAKILYQELEKRNLIELISQEFDVQQIHHFIARFLYEFGLQLDEEDLINIEIEEMEHESLAKVSPCRRLANFLHSEREGNNHYLLEYKVDGNRIFRGNKLSAIISIKCSCGMFITDTMHHETIKFKLLNREPYGFFCPKCHNQFTLGCNFKDFVAKVEYFPVEDTCEEGQESKSHIPSNASSIPSKAKKSCVSPFAREIIKKRCRYIKKKTDNARPKLSKYELKIKHLPPREAFYFLILPKNNEFKKGIKQVMIRSWNKEKFLSFLQELAQKSGVLVLFNERTLKRELFSLTSLLKRLLRREKIQWKEFCKMIHIFSRWDEKYKSRMESNASRMFLDMMDGNSRMGKKMQVRKAKDLRKALLSFNSESSLRKVTASTILREIRKRYCSEDSKEMIIYLVNLLLGTIGNYREFNRFKKSLKHFCAFLPFDIDYFKPRLHELKVKYRRADPYLEFYDLMI